MSSSPSASVTDTSAVERQPWLTTKRISRGFSWALSIYLLAVCFNLVQQSQILFRLQGQVRDMEDRLGSVTPPNENQMWLKLIDHNPSHYAWRLYLPPTKSLVMATAMLEPDGRLNIHKKTECSSMNGFPSNNLLELGFTLRSDGTQETLITMPNSGSQGFSRGTSPMSMVGPFLPPEAVEIDLFAADAEQSVDLDCMVPLLQWRATDAYVQTQLAAGLISDRDAEVLRQPHIWYFGTSEAMNKLKETSGDQQP